MTRIDALKRQVLPEVVCCAPKCKKCGFYSRTEVPRICNGCVWNDTAKKVNPPNESRKNEKYLDEAVRKSKRPEANDNILFQCEKCGYKFLTDGGLEYHKAIAHKPFTDAEIENMRRTAFAEDDAYERSCKTGKDARKWGV